MKQTLAQRLLAFGREIAVIVLGVSVALGADALYDRHQEKEERTRILESLVLDLRVDSATYANALADSLDVVATRTLLRLLGDRSQPVGRFELARAVRESILLPFEAKESGTYGELAMTGRIALIEDPDLRQSLLRYYSRPFLGIPPEVWSVHLTTTYAGYDRSLRGHLGAAYVPFMRCNIYSPEYEACLLSSDGGLDIARLRADAEFMEQVIGMTTAAVRYRGSTRLEARAHHDLAERLGRAVSR